MELELGGRGCIGYLISIYNYVTGSGKTGLITHGSRCIFITQGYMNMLSNFTIKISQASSLFLLAVFPKPSGKPHEQSGP